MSSLTKVLVPSFLCVSCVSKPVRVTHHSRVRIGLSKAEKAGLEGGTKDGQ